MKTNIFCQRHPFGKIFKLIIATLFIVTLTNCSHWNWVFKNEALVREKICLPDTITKTIVQDHMVPLIQTDTNLLKTLNLYENQLFMYEDSMYINSLNQAKRDSLLGQLTISNKRMQNLVSELKRFASNTQVRVIEKRVPYAVYYDKQSTLQKLDAAHIIAKNLRSAVWILSFVIVILAGIIVFILRK